MTIKLTINSQYREYDFYNDIVKYKDFFFNHHVLIFIEKGTK